MGFAPLDPEVSLDLQSVALRKAARLVTVRCESDRSAEALADLAVLRLVQGTNRNAIALLERISRAAPRDPFILNDLAAAYLASEAANPANAIHLPLALAAAERASALAPNLLEAQFNRAVALERLALEGADVAWRLYLQHDRVSSWAREAQARRRAFHRPTASQLWQAAFPRIRQAARAGQDPRLQELLSRFPLEVRRYGEEELLIAAAEDASRGGASQNLTMARHIAGALAEVTGDRMLLDAVEALVQAVSRGDREKVNLLAGGHRAFRDGLHHARAFDFPRAERAFEEARDALSRAASPFHRCAQLELAACRIQAFRNDSAEVLASEVTRDAFAAQSYPNLRGRAHWLRGLVLHLRARQEEALAEFRQGLSFFERTGEGENIASLQHLIFEYSYFIGDHERAWRDLFPALQRVRDMTTATRQYRIVNGGVVEALALDRPEAALWFSRDALAWARRSKQPETVALALRWRAICHQALGASTLALRDLALARRYAFQLPAGNLRTGTLGDLLLIEAELRSANEPVIAARLFSEALSILERTDYRIQFLRALVGRARTHEARGAWADAERDLASALDEIEGRRSSLIADSRAVFLDDHHELFEELIRIQAEVRQRPDLAYRFAEQSQARVLAELVSEGSQVDIAEALDWQEVGQALPDRTVVIQYFVGKQQTYVWEISRAGGAFSRIPRGERDLTDAVRALRRRIDSGSPAARLLATELYSVLIGSRAPKGSRDDTLVIVPDGPLHALPFAALRSPAGHYLIEERALVVAPSSRVFLQLTRAPSSSKSEGATVLAVAAPVTSAAFESFTSLPKAESEAAEIVGLYSGGTSLIGTQATKDKLLSLAPKYDVLHLGTHARSNAHRPQRSLLGLAPSQSDPTGALYAEELLSLRLDKPKLVVLAACSAGAGALSQTEGALSLARAFLVAGARSVVAPLWKIDDRASSILMRKFHEQLSGGEPPAAALRAAQLELINSNDQELAAPESWAGFELYGASESSAQFLER